MSEVDHKQMVLAEIVAVLGTGPDVTMSQIEARLGELYVQHEHKGDQHGMTLISAAWGDIQVMMQTADTAITVAAAAQEVAQTLAGQRDAVIEEHAKLKTAIENYDARHPLVADLMEGMEEQFSEDLMNSEAYVSDCPACEITQNAMIEVTHDQADIFFDCLTGQRLQDLDEDVQALLKGELKTFITNFVWKFTQAEVGNDITDDTEDWEDE